MQLPITIGLHRSFFGVAGFVLIHAVAAVALWLTPWSLWAKYLALGGLAASASLVSRLWFPEVDALRLLANGLLECRLAGEEGFRPAELLPGATVHPWLTVVRLGIGEVTVAIVILGDSTTEEEFRRLRVWLRWRAVFSGAGKDDA